MRCTTSLLILSIASAICAAPLFAAIPNSAQQHRSSLVRNARAVWGIDAPVASFAAQFQQESAWNANALSPVGAKGMAQFMPATANWIAEQYPDDLGNAQPTNPSWAIRALVQYDFWLYTRIRAKNACERLAFTLSAYNGGLGWVNRDKTLASGKGLDPLVWFGSVERVNAGRSPANWQENRAYPQRILWRYEPMYVAANWGSGACND
ncbi:transglycosylase SLT domain-containing protein [Undibacterium sp. 14-3-2]|jgi:soluble lytic murein transglycosylase-like protein|uniref:transglycosylase SLT domain-containing protein n=1 Tax=Undibacterium sp. 14-3-2 TaxID=2800129 RepID=UPI0019061D87|nr:transglycosylase SLT domain-containing protein [Undibacterium sp. 14-3-2]MBK1890716.1 transglycosylase SLT domain-containing protein [Undibacterium sp. 14-3-2]